MPMDFSNSGYISKNGAKSLNNSEHVIYSTTHNSSFSNFKASPQRMEKLFLTVLSWIGLGSYVGGILLNAGTWKADILVVFGGAFLLLKFIRLTLKTWYECRRQEIEIKMLQKKANESEE